MIDLIVSHSQSLLVFEDQTFDEFIGSLQPECELRPHLAIKIEIIK